MHISERIAPDCILLNVGIANSASLLLCFVVMSLSFWHMNISTSSSLKNINSNSGLWCISMLLMTVHWSPIRLLAHVVKITLGILYFVYRFLHRIIEQVYSRVYNIVNHRRMMFRRYWFGCRVCYNDDFSIASTNHLRNPNVGCDPN